MMTMVGPPCEIYDCDSCDHYSAARCPGCADGNTYLQRRGLDTCGIYRCIIDQGIDACNKCERTSCEYAQATDFICPLRGKFENRRWWAGRLAKELSKRKGIDETTETSKISDRTIDRMRWYLVALDSFVAQGVGSVSSWQLAQRVGVKAPLIRKDLSRFGEFGTPSLGYDVKYLRRKILDILRLNETRHVVWLGAQRLREHLAVLPRLSQHYCHIVAVLDPDLGEVGRKIENVQVLHLDSLNQVLENLSVDVAVIALPAQEAQKAANILARASINAILNLSPTLLTTPERVTVRNIDVCGELLALSYYCDKGDGRIHTKKPLQKSGGRSVTTDA